MRSSRRPPTMKLTGIDSVYFHWTLMNTNELGVYECNWFEELNLKLVSKINSTHLLSFWSHFLIDDSKKPQKKKNCVQLNFLRFWSYSGKARHLNHHCWCLDMVVEDWTSGGFSPNLLCSLPRAAYSPQNSVNAKTRVVRVL